jgi:hypothetical protein
LRELETNKRPISQMLTAMSSSVQKTSMMIELRVFSVADFDKISATAVLSPVVKTAHD